MWEGMLWTSLGNSWASLKDLVAWLGSPCRLRVCLSSSGLLCLLKLRLFEVMSLTLCIFLLSSPCCMTGSEAGRGSWESRRCSLCSLRSSAVLGLLAGFSNRLLLGQRPNLLLQSQACSLQPLAAPLLFLMALTCCHFFRFSICTRTSLPWSLVSSAGLQISGCFPYHS